MFSLLVGLVLAGVFFLRYWRLGKDTFFLWFAAGFLTFAISWFLLASAGAFEHSHYIYVVRLLGFLQIIAAILLKNRTSKA
ncbi:hypothetical protein BH11MYX1_BH11MYX1_08370 [soil metagenome]